MARIDRATTQDSFEATYSAADLLGILASAKNPDGTDFTMPTIQGAPASADILNGHVAQTATTAAATLITVPAGRTWRGHVSVQCAASVVAADTTAGQALGLVATAGANVAPAAGTILSCEARAAANAATGTAGSNGHASADVPVTVVAPAGNAVTLTLESTQAGTNTRVMAAASGYLT